ncbi:MAG: HEAT repeat domain-containing protein, partial [Bdellovibrionota bacterium]
DKFIGDAMMAVFYAQDDAKTIRPGDQISGPSPESTALQAIYCGLEMRERLAEFNQKRIAAHKSAIEIGVGITFGEVVSGPVGTKDRMDFTVIGDVVNLANRIEKLSKQGKHTKIVFSHHVEEKVRGLLTYEEMSAEKIRGKEEEVRVFELIGIRDLETLVMNFKSRDTALRRRSVELLGHSRNSRALPYVLAALKSDDEGTRLQAVLAAAKLAGRDDPDAMDALLERLDKEASAKVQSTIIMALGRICTNERILDIASFLDSADERIVANTIEALGQVRSPRCSDLILPKLASRNNRVKANAAMALFAAGHIEVIDTLKPMLMHSDPLMRSSAAFAIGELTVLGEQEKLAEKWRDRKLDVKLFLGEVQECVPMLVALLRDPDPMVKRQCIIALGKIRDKSAVLPLIENVNIAEDSKELIRDVTAALRSIGSHRLVRDVISKLSQ